MKIGRLNDSIEYLLRNVVILFALKCAGQATKAV